MDTLATALYVKTDDLLKKSPQLAPYRPKTGIGPKLAGAELVTLAVMKALMGFTSEARWLRYARAHLCHLFPYLPQQPGYNKRLRGAAPLIRHCIRALAASTASWTDDVWIVDSTPWSAAAPARLPNAPTWPEWAEYGYCASHSRYFCGPAPAPGHYPGRPARRVRPGRRRSRRARRPAGHLHRRSGPDHHPARPGPGRRQELLRRRVRDRPGRHRDQAAAARPPRRAPRAAAHLFKPPRQIIESVNDTSRANSTSNATAATHSAA